MSKSISQSSTAAAATLEDIVREYFEALGYYDYALAHRLLRTHSALIQGSRFPALHNALSQFASCETHYGTFADLKQKWFRKDSLSVLYSAVAEDMEKLSRLDGVSKFFLELFDQLQAFCGVRQRLVSVYRTFINNPTSLDPASLLATLDQLLEDNRRSFFHPYFALLRLVFLWEASILANLLRAQQALAVFSFKDTMVCLYRARSDLEQWRTRCYFNDKRLGPPLANAPAKPSAAPSSSGQGNDSVSLVPPNYLWLMEFASSVFAKATLYFYNIIQKQENELGAGTFAKNSALGKNEFDHCSAIRAFQKRTDATIVALIYEVSSAEWEPFSPSGYQCPGVPYRPATGLNSFPCIFSHPATTFPIEHLPNVISIIMDNRESLSLSTDAPVVFFDTRINVLYIVGIIDPRVFCVAMFNERKSSSKEAALAEQVGTVAASLRNSRIFQRLGKF